MTKTNVLLCITGSVLVGLLVAGANALVPFVAATFTGILLNSAIKGLALGLMTWRDSASLSRFMMYATFFALMAALLAKPGSPLVFLLVLNYLQAVGCWLAHLAYPRLRALLGSSSQAGGL